MDDTALRDEIAKVRERWHAAYRASAETPEDDAAFRDRLATMERTGAEYDALIRAGALLTLGPLEDDCENTG